MTFATKITMSRLCLVPVFAFLAITYGMGAGSGAPVESYRWAALSVFIFAAATDGIDGWIARRFNQRSDLGAYLDPIADKALVLSAILILTFLDWGPDGWRIPLWFAAIVVLRDCIILGGIRVLYSAKKKVAIRPHWTGKACTFSLFVVLGWVMLRIIPLPIIYPCVVAGIFTVWSMVECVRQGVVILRGD
jgi:CDP-diacylglycerol--glycerol-3-phosphate 3-phosphatidyltransferase